MVDTVHYDTSSAKCTRLAFLLILRLVFVGLFICDAVPLVCRLAPLVTIPERQYDGRGSEVSNYGSYRICPSGTDRVDTWQGSRGSPGRKCVANEVVDCDLTAVTFSHLSRTRVVMPDLQLPHSSSGSHRLDIR